MVRGLAPSAGGFGVLSKRGAFGVGVSNQAGNSVDRGSCVVCMCRGCVLDPESGVMVV